MVVLGVYNKLAFSAALGSIWSLSDDEGALLVNA